MNKVKPMNFLSSSLWQSLINIIVSSLAVFAAIIIPFLIYSKQRKRKEITCIVVTSFVIYPSYTLSVLKVLNSGNTPILPDDFYEPVSFNVRNGNIQGFQFLASTHESLEKAINVSSKKIHLLPTLLNEGDEVELELLLDTKEEFIVDSHSRIVDLDAVKVRYAPTLFTIPEWIFNILFVSSAIFISLYFSNSLTILNKMLAQFGIDFVLPIRLLFDITLNIRPVTIFAICLIESLVWSFCGLIATYLLKMFRILFVYRIRTTFIKMVKWNLLAIVLELSDNIQIKYEWYKSMSKLIKDEEKTFEDFYKTPEEESEDSNVQVTVNAPGRTSRTSY